VQRGYVKVWRKIEDSGLIQLPNTLALFMLLLLNATHKDRKVGTPNGVIILKRGQYISGRIELAAKLKQTEQQIRTSLKRLMELEIITIEATNRFSVYTIENYSKYQDSEEVINQHDNQQITNKQPTDNQQITTKQELNNLNIKELNKNHTQKNEFFADIDSDVYQAWLSVRKAKRGGKISKVVYDAVAREALKADLTIEQAVRECAERNWITFNADWYTTAKAKNQTPANGQPKTKMDISGIDYKAGVNPDGSF
jgi:hypothetical protein